MVSEKPELTDAWKTDACTMTVSLLTESQRELKMIARDLDLNFWSIKDTESPYVNLVKSTTVRDIWDATTLTSHCKWRGMTPLSDESPHMTICQISCCMWHAGMLLVRLVTVCDMGWHLSDKPPWHIWHLSDQSLYMTWDGVLVNEMFNIICPFLC